MRTPQLIDRNDVQRAAHRIAAAAHRTPVMTCATLNALSKNMLLLKCEQFQKTGSFKFRGAFNAVAVLPDDVAARGVVTHSSGNHAQALALAARIHGIPAYIVMPSTASEVKRRAVVGYGAQLTPCEPTLAAREETAERIRAETGAALIPPYNHPDVIAGQGTAALELTQDNPGLQVLVAPVGGGGLISGTCAVASAHSPRIAVIAAEPKGADDAARSKRAGKLIPQTSPRTVADGLLTSLGDLTWPYVRDVVDRVITVDEDAIIAAMRLAWERAKLLIEPSSAVALAAVLSDEFRSRCSAKRVGVILSGGNVNLDALPW